LDPIDRPPDGREGLAAFRRALEEESAQAHSIRLSPGQVLVVDNHRVLHGRASLLKESARRLRRFWIRLRR
jgi:alpha-ketoglutarate-dependent taurine dioxygenase